MYETFEDVCAERDRLLPEHKSAMKTLREIASRGCSAVSIQHLLDGPCT